VAWFDHNTSKLSANMQPLLRAPYLGKDPDVAAEPHGLAIVAPP